jgi:hypothetical protein
VPTNFVTDKGKLPVLQTVSFLLYPQMEQYEEEEGEEEGQGMGKGGYGGGEGEREGK